MSDNNLPGISGQSFTINLDQSWYSPYDRTFQAHCELDRILRENFKDELIMGRSQINITDDMIQGLNVRDLIVNEAPLLNLIDIPSVKVDSNEWQWTMRLPEEDIIKDEQYHYPF